MEIIYQTASLKELCNRLATQEFIAVDLEFVREKTYYPVPCLIQVASQDEVDIIDPLAPDLNLSAFFDLMVNPNVVKVFHSCRQDVEIIYNLSGKIPTPLFDTQIAAMVCGFGESISYERLVKAVLNINLDKTSCLSNWQLRPLDEKQLQYACGDVTHLIKIYKYLQQNMQANHREDWIKEEIKITADVHNYYTSPDEAWLKIKFRSHNSRVLSNLKALAEWRELRAKNKNVPRQSVVKDDTLTMIATAGPKSHQDLEKIRGIRKDLTNGKLADEILEVIAGVKTDNELCRPNDNDNINYNPALVEMFRLLLKVISQEHKVVARIVANETDIQKLGAFIDKDNAVLQGWRWEIFGQKALELRDGKLAIRYNPATRNIEFIKK